MSFHGHGLTCRIDKREKPIVHVDDEPSVGAIECDAADHSFLTLYFEPPAAALAGDDVRPKLRKGTFVGIGSEWRCGGSGQSDSFDTQVCVVCIYVWLIAVVCEFKLVGH